MRRVEAAEKRRALAVSSSIHWLVSCTAIEINTAMLLQNLNLAQAAAARSLARQPPWHGF